MNAPRLAIAAGNYLGTEAAVRVAAEGGNAVDACLASAIMAWVAEPTFASIGGAGFVMVRTPGGTVEAIDGNNAMPFAAPTEPGRGVERVHLDYSDGMETGMGAGSIAVPGVLEHDGNLRSGFLEDLAPAHVAALDSIFGVAPVHYHARGAELLGTCQCLRQ